MEFPAWTTGALRDVAVLVVILLQWIVVSLVVDSAGADAGARRAASLYLALSSVSVNAYTIYGSFRVLGKTDVPTETVLGLFCEVVSMAQAWGCAFCAARTWSLADDHPFHQNSFIQNSADSVFEMSLVQAGVGWAAAAPTTLTERLVAWCTAYVGGVLVVNMFLVSIILNRRGYWTAAPPSIGASYVPAPSGVSSGDWRVSLK